MSLDLFPAHVFYFGQIFKNNYYLLFFPGIYFSKNLMVFPSF
ncbi:hypothetical protein LEP1GSC192_2635 [Leptospira sp. B5-022]|nr:hypothetical protein LEP1GSC192_2635 [Leptospira sp. B5-022]